MNCAEAKEMLAGTIKDGSALRKLAELVEAQGGNPEAVYDTELLPKASIEYEYRADTEGYVSRIVCDIVGTSAMVLGGGRENKDSVIDLSVGIVLEAKKGAYVHKEMCWPDSMPMMKISFLTQLNDLRMHM